MADDEQEANEPFRWAFITPSGIEVRIDDLPIEVIEPICLEHGVGWGSLLAVPIAHLSAGRELYQQACRHIGEEPAEILRPRDLVDVIERVKPDTPTTFGDGLPKAEGDTPTSTDSSSGAPESSGGPPT